MLTYIVCIVCLGISKYLKKFKKWLANVRNNPMSTNNF